MGETCYSLLMKTITIRDLRQRWPEAEAALQVEDEILITRDSKPVAKLVPVEQEKDDIFGFMKGKGKIEIKGDIVSPILSPEEWGDLY